MKSSVRCVVSRSLVVRGYAQSVPLQSPSLRRAHVSNSTSTAQTTCRLRHGRKKKKKKKSRLCNLKLSKPATVLHCSMKRGRDVASPQHGAPLPSRLANMSDSWACATNWGIRCPRRRPRWIQVRTVPLYLNNYRRRQLKVAQTTWCPCFV